MYPFTTSVSLPVYPYVLSVISVSLCILSLPVYHYQCIFMYYQCILMYPFTTSVSLPVYPYVLSVISVSLCILSLPVYHYQCILMYYQCILMYPFNGCNGYNGYNDYNGYHCILSIPVNPLSFHYQCTTTSVSFLSLFLPNH